MAVEAGGPSQLGPGEDDSTGACADDGPGADDSIMFGWLRIVTLVPPAGLIPLGLAVLAPFIRFAPVPVEAREGVRQAAGASR
jgi:hypothetical protein